MRTECNPEPLLFAPVDGRAVVASFDGGAITSDAGALLLGATDRTIDLVGRFAACFSDGRDRERIARTRWRRSWPSASSGSHSATRISSIMIRSGTIPCWRCSPASSRPGAAGGRRSPASRL